ncbi:hypothetical protein J3Q64DRAFT_1746528 [Phycomyces blakesleeanus]|uniref:F-box domain-containing protein n=2 Tax=Phycomyces blakesleeanus TaxID=4837 RepID=A0A162N942_PHYB8|nr:hypothetical protein PHYBLDRAFT_78161 [Phycomyces blakesleeanus NRRL 1555(-)]OAD72258.1 hypothetical protein PHYBLDRAFT_78161 [Phycomyces blakesleeanus NRRL 1555(-)]|eukprot:XP_018290298.1 hypothetical protein PHYBLDRAFT_78161 [Phycomyces blakesleeanus NRRL 1555(-)]
MLTSILPLELIFHIASYLSPKDKLRCILVARSWRNIFQDSLWETMEISHQKILDSVCHLPLSNQNVYKRHGQLVRKLCIQEDVVTTAQNISTLQDCFWNIRSLYVQRDCLSETCFGDNVNWSPWKSLTELDLELDYLTVQTPEKKILNILSHLPRLVRLNLAQFWQGRTIAFSVQDLETLHAHLPDLAQLSLKVDFAQFSTKDLLQSTSLKPAKRVKELTIHSRITDHRWFYYFTRKYSGLTTLKWMTRGVKKIQDDHHSEAASMLSVLPCAFAHLKTVDISACGDPRRSYLIFRDLFCALKVPIKQLTYNVSSSLDEHELIERIVQLSTNSYSDTLERLTIGNSMLRQRPFSVVTALNRSPRLVHFDFSSPNSLVELDVVLDRCPSLKTLCISQGSLSTKPSPPITPVSLQHGLRLIDLNGVKVKSSALSYLSSRCRSLNYMHLKNTSIYGQISEKTRNLCIDMSFSRFELLRIHAIKVYSNSDLTSTDPSIELITLARSAPTPPPRKKARSSSTSSFPLSLYRKGTHVQNWLHSDCEIELAIGGACSMQMLDKQDIDHACVSLIDRPYNKEDQGKMVNNSLRRINTSGTSGRSNPTWPKSLCLGYSTLKCGIIEVYEIDSIKSHTDCFWKNLKN